jgi:hypothetical protein
MALAPSEPAAPGAWHHLKLLFGLKLKLSGRGLARSKTTLIGTILAIVLFLPLSLGVAVGTVLGLSSASPLIAEQGLRAGLLALGAFWVLTPLLGFSLNDSYDITRLFIYPIPLRRLFVGTILGALLDTPTLLLLPGLCGVVIGLAFHGVAPALVALIAVPLFLFQTLALSQAAILATAGILKSRRFRDVALVIVPLFWMSWQVFNQFFWRDAARRIDWRTALQSPVWETISLLPPGLAARAMGAALRGEPLWATALLLALAVVTAATVVVAGWLVAKVYDGEDVGLRAPVDTKPQARERAPARPTADGPLPPVVAAVIRKDIATFTRDPHYRVVAMNLVYLMVFGAFLAFRRGGGAGHSALDSTAAVGLGSGLVLFQQAFLFANLFGTESGAGLLFNFPMSRRQLLMGKNIALLLVLIPIDLFLALLLCGLLGRTDLLPALLPWMVLAPVLMASVGNLLSVFFPYKAQGRGFRAKQPSSGYGFAYTLLMLGVSLASLALYAPVLAAILIPFFGLWGVASAWSALTVPLAAGYVAVFYGIALRAAEGFLLQREPWIVAKVTRTESS